MTIRGVDGTIQLQVADGWVTVYPRPWAQADNPTPQPATAPDYWGLADYMDLMPMPSFYRAAYDTRMAQFANDRDDMGWTYEYGWHTAHWHRPCSFCGHVFWHNQDACPQCGGPTPAWWARLDTMIAKWKRGGR